MTERVFRCPNCGADVAFASPGAIVITCSYCSWISYRADVDLESIGEVAQPALLASHFRIGTAGSFQGKGFTVRGQIQLDHGAGPWNEWAAEDEDGEWLWIAEAQGEVLVFREVDPPESKKAEKGELQPCRRLKAFGRTWACTEIGEGRVLTVKGELPIQVRIGERTAYADLQSGSRGVATLDFTRAGPPEALVGERVAVGELALDPLTRPEHRPETVQAKRIDCASCGGGIELVDPEHALRIGCPSCGVLLEHDSEKVRAIGKAQEARGKPAIPLGAKGRLAGEELAVLGCLERRVKAVGRWWPWREYLLRNAAGQYRWLVENEGHWMLVRPVPYGAIEDGRSQVTYMDGRFKHFTSGKAEVHWVLGEFYWQVRAGDRVDARDYVHPPYALSIESNALEVQASAGGHVEPEDVADAFPGTRLPRRRGVGMVQPNPTSPRRDWAVFAVLVALVLALRVWFGVAHENRDVLAGEFGPTPADQDAEPAVAFSDPFRITAERANLRVALHVPNLDQGWVGLNGALVEVESGEVTTFATSAQRYSGVEDGESWSEGDRSGTVYLGGVGAGEYRLRLAASGWDKGVGMPYRVSVRSQVPRTLFAFLAILVLLVLPIAATIRWWSFEYGRWKDSDHPWGES